MADTPKLEIPHELRTIAEQGVDQARSAFDSFLVAAHKAFDDAGHKVDAVHDNAREMGKTTVGFAEANIAASFDFAARLAKAQTIEEWSRIQAEFVTEQAHRLSDQAKALAEAGAAHASFKL